MRTLKVEKTVEVEVSADDLTDEQILEEMEQRGIGPPDKDTGDFGDDEIRDEYEHRFGRHSYVTVQQLYDEFRQRGDAPQLLRDYIYDHCGRILP